MAYLLIGCRLIVGLVFLVAVVGKITSHVEFTTSVRRLVPWFPTRPTAWAVFTAEVATVVLLGVPATATAGFVVALTIVLGFTLAIAAALRRGEATACRCFGASNTPIGPSHVVRNCLLLAATAVGMLASLLAPTGEVRVTDALLALVPATLLATGFVAFEELAALFTPFEANR